MWKKLKRSERLLSFFRLLKCWTVAIGELSSASVVACNKRYICTFYDFFVSYVARTIFSFSAVVVFFAGQFEKRSKRKKLQSAPNLNLAPATMNAFIRFNNPQLSFFFAFLFSKVWHARIFQQSNYLHLNSIHFAINYLVKANQKLQKIEMMECWWFTSLDKCYYFSKKFKLICIEHWTIDIATIINCK